MGSEKERYSRSICDSSDEPVQKGSLENIFLKSLR